MELRTKIPLVNGEDWDVTAYRVTEQGLDALEREVRALATSDGGSRYYDLAIGEMTRKIIVHPNDPH